MAMLYITIKWPSREPGGEGELWSETKSLSSFIESQLVLCSVEVFPYHPSPSLPSWPNWKNLQTVISKPGQNCRDSCLEHKLVRAYKLRYMILIVHIYKVCESSFFSLINTHEAVVNHLDCTVVHTLQEE